MDSGRILSTLRAGLDAHEVWKPFGIHGLRMKRMLVNVLDPEESRVAIVDDGTLLEYHLEETDRRSLVGNVYLARVVNIEPGIQAAFLDVGEQKSAFLHVSDLHPSYQGATEIPWEGLSEKLPRDREKPLIQTQLRKGQTLLVQISKEAIGNKGPTVTTFVSLPGRFLVLMLGMSRAGVSRKIDDPEQRDRLREIAASLNGPPEVGLIIRTAGHDQPRKVLERDLRYLTRVWEDIVTQVGSEKAPALLYRESDLVIRTVRDLYDPEIDEVLVDREAEAEQVREFLGRVMPRHASRVKHYEGSSPLFSRFRVESEIDNIYDRRVPLSSGGSLVIDETEALVAIDVNSGSYRGEKDLEGTALRINLEAASEIARQLRLRDIGGVVVCDFIDMTEAENRRTLEQHFREAMRPDRAKTWFSRLSRFGIIELTRQRLRPSKDRVARETCPVCRGRGTIRNARSIAAGIFRQLRRGLAEPGTQEAVVTVGDEVLDLLINRRRDDLVNLENEHGKRIVIRPGHTSRDGHGSGSAPSRFSVDFR